MSALAPGERWDGQAGGKRTKPHRGIFLLLFLLLFGRGSEEKGCKRSDDASGSPEMGRDAPGWERGAGKEQLHASSHTRGEFLLACITFLRVCPQNPSQPSGPRWVYGGWQSHSSPSTTKWQWLQPGHKHTSSSQQYAVCLLHLLQYQHKHVGLPVFCLFLYIYKCMEKMKETQVGANERRDVCCLRG